MRLASVKQPVVPWVALHGLQVIDDAHQHGVATG